MVIIERHAPKLLVSELLNPALRRFASSASSFDERTNADATDRIRSRYFDTPSLDPYMTDDREQERRVETITCDKGRARGARPSRGARRLVEGARASSGACSASRPRGHASAAAPKANLDL
jgi:hypothetical protein